MHHIDWNSVNVDEQKYSIFFCYPVSWKSASRFIKLPIIIWKLTCTVPIDYVTQFKTEFDNSKLFDSIPFFMKEQVMKNQFLRPDA